jgi:cyclopropane-fatty-acyl-phospholipid synthase
MTYSSALFTTGQESLESAQAAKYASMVDQMGAKAGDHVLEIGCGWGGFAEYAARERGLRVTGLTISQAQHDYAVARIAAAGLADRVQIKLQDYRDERGLYDGIASIEMFEAVGERYWPTYFNTLRDRLKPGASATLQIITVADHRFEAYLSGGDVAIAFGAARSGGAGGANLCPFHRIWPQLQPNPAPLARKFHRKLAASGGDGL